MGRVDIAVSVSKVMQLKELDIFFVSKKYCLQACVNELWKNYGFKIVGKNSSRHLNIECRDHFRTV